MLLVLAGLAGTLGVAGAAPTPVYVNAWTKWAASVGAGERKTAPAGMIVNLALYTATGRTCWWPVDVPVKGLQALELRAGSARGQLAGTIRYRGGRENVCESLPAPVVRALAKRPQDYWLVVTSARHPTGALSGRFRKGVVGQG